MKDLYSEYGIGIPFFTEIEWARAKMVMADGKFFHATYAEFLQAFEGTERRAEAQNVPTIRVSIIVDELVDWCHAACRKINTDAASDYAALKAMDKDSEPQ